MFNFPKGSKIKFLHSEGPRWDFVTIHSVGVPDSSYDEIFEKEADWAGYLQFQKEVLNWLRALADQENENKRARYMLPRIRKNSNVTPEKPYRAYVDFENENSALLFKLRWIG